jgi:hypothetical protein
MVSMLPGAPGQLVLQDGVGARAGLAHAVLDVGQGAHGELQAAGQIGAVAVAQCHAPTHDVVAEVCQVASVHAAMMTHQGGNLESLLLFLSVCCLNRPHQRNTVVSIGEPIRLVSVEVGAFDA